MKGADQKPLALVWFALDNIQLELSFLSFLQGLYPVCIGYSMAQDL